MVKETKPGSGAAKPPVAPVAPEPAPGQPGTAPAPVTAAQSVPLFGGKRGGKARKDGLAPGSPEAVAADRKKDRERKERLRQETARLAEPAPLYSAIEGLGDSVPPAPGAGLPGVPAALPAPDVPWDSELLRPLIEEVVKASEAARVHKFQGKAEEAQLSRELVRQIAEDAKYVPAFKTTVGRTAPNALAKALNRMGLSGKYSDEGLCLLAMLSIFVQGKRVESRLDKIIEEARIVREGKANGETTP